jgi:hypothetical protein
MKTTAFKLGGMDDELDHERRVQVNVLTRPQSTAPPQDLQNSRKDNGWDHEPRTIEQALSQVQYCKDVRSEMSQK